MWFKNLLWEWRGVWITTPSITGLIILLRFAGLLQPSEWMVFDQYIRLRPPIPFDQRVVIVGIDETDLDTIGQAMIPDGVYAELLTNLKARQPRAIGLDIYRDLPVEPGHEALVEIFDSTPNLIGIQKVIGERGRGTVAPPPALAAKGQVGANDLIVDADNQVRRGLISVDTPNGETVYSFSLYLALLYLEAEGIGPEAVAGTESWQLGQTQFVPFEANDGGYIRADAGGYQLLINYRGPVGHFETVSMRDVLAGRVPKDWGRDRIILIGSIAESSRDFFFTPYSGGILALPEPMAGIELHANLTSQIISAALDGRSLIKTWPEPMEWLWILFWAGIGATLTWQLRYTDNWSRFALQRIIGSVLAVAILLISTYGLLVAGWWIPVVPPLIAFTGAAVAITTYIARTAGRIRKTFGRYLSDEIVANLLESREGLSLGGERRKITILTSDLRGFTAISERFPPEEVIKILNFYLGHMTDVITDYQGTIDDFMGDGILAMFGAPTTREDDAQRAVACAVAMQLAMVTVNKTMKDWGFPTLEMGIGLNTGEVVVGNIGSEKRTQYSIIGDQVNLAYRIESYTVGGQILISQSTLAETGPILRFNQTNRYQAVYPKGVRSPIKIYDIKGIGGKYNLFLPQVEEIFVSLPKAMPLQYRILEGKKVGDDIFDGNLVKLSPRGAIISVGNTSDPPLPAVLENIKLNLLDHPQELTDEDIYAKVLDTPIENDSFYVHFTAKPPAIAAKLEALYQNEKS
ncbi:MAG: adenylate/guanylate cyclase domain-containing protein [Cyanothece sp. SIO1E1]|nr:adenylate/guanylate cyclase domain-containing protein [Cyanothece sp. SIO1E1]